MTRCCVSRAAFGITVTGRACFRRSSFARPGRRLNRWHSPRKADLIYLRLLRLAARHLESDVAAALSLLLENQARWDETDVERLMPPPPVPVPLLAQPVVNLAQYDALLQEVSYDTRLKPFTSSANCSACPASPRPSPKP